MKKLAERIWGYSVLVLAAIFHVLWIMEMGAFAVENISSLCLTLSGSFAVLFIKCVRMYLVLMPNKMNTNVYLKIYLKTAYVNAFIPFKLGEFYRVYEYAKNLNSFSLGMMVVIIDRLFDSIPLCLIVAISIFQTKSSFSGMLLVVTLFIIIFFIYYIVFPATYRLFNEYLIFKSSTNKGLFLLKGLEYMKKIHMECDQALRDKFVLLLLLSVAAWVLEFSVALLNQQSVESLGLFHKLIEYVNAALFGNKNTAMQIFGVCIGGIAVTGLLLWEIKNWKKERGCRKERTNEHGCSI